MYQPDGLVEGDPLKWHNLFYSTRSLLSPGFGKSCAPGLSEPFSVIPVKEQSWLDDTLGLLDFLRDV